MTTTETMKLALEALEAFLRFAAIHHDGPDTSDKYLAEDYAVEGFRKARQVLPALRTAIAEAEKQEPVGEVSGHDWSTGLLYRDLEPGTPLYTTPPAAAPVQQEPEDIAALVEGMEVSIDVSTGDHDSGNRLFGNVTLAQENQGSKHGLILLVQDPEPNFNIAPPASPVQFKCTVVDDQHPAGVPLSQWGTPPAAQRQWVGLTDEEIDEWTPEIHSVIQAIEAKLKEKNRG